jgi:hypothetical protein
VGSEGEGEKVKRMRCMLFTVCFVRFWMVLGFGT